MLWVKHQSKKRTARWELATAGIRLCGTNKQSEFVRHRNFLQYHIQQLRAHRLSDNGYVGLFSGISLSDSSSAIGCGETETRGKEEEGESNSPLSVKFGMVYNWCSQKKKSAVHAASSLRQIILLVVCNTVKYDL